VKQNLELKKYLQGTTNVRNHAKATTRNYAEIFGNSIFTQQTFLLVPFLFPFQENKVKMVMGPCYQRRRHNDVAFSPSPPFCPPPALRRPATAHRSSPPSSAPIHQATARPSHRLLRPLLLLAATATSLSRAAGRVTGGRGWVRRGVGHRKKKNLTWNVY
jgi:hypothetical protein